MKDVIYFKKEVLRLMHVQAGVDWVSRLEYPGYDGTTYRIRVKVDRVAAGVVVHYPYMRKGGENQLAVFAVKLPVTLFLRTYARRR